MAAILSWPQCVNGTVLFLCHQAWWWAEPWGGSSKRAEKTPHRGKTSDCTSYENKIVHSSHGKRLIYLDYPEWCNDDNRKAWWWSWLLLHDVSVVWDFLYNFYPRPVLAFGYCRCLRLCVCVCVCLSVCLCVNHLLVRAITRDPFKLGSPNLDRRCKRPWLRSLLFWGAIDLDLQGQI